MARQWRRAAPTSKGKSSAPGDDRAERQSEPKCSEPAMPVPPTNRPYVDRFGHLHSESIFKNWSAAAIKALGIRRKGYHDD